MSVPHHDCQHPRGPGLFYVNSKITDSCLSHEAFTAWYNDIHVPDIFKSRGILSAFRYFTIYPEKVERPYLALYPLEDIGFLYSDSFSSIPVTHDSLPGSGLIFDLADFDTRYYSIIKTIKGAAIRPDTPNYVVTLGFDAEGDDSSNAVTLISKVSAEEIVRISLYRLVFAPQRSSGSGNKKSDPPKFLAVLEFNKEVDLLTLTSEITGAQGAEFKLIKAFGKKMAYYD